MQLFPFFFLKKKGRPHYRELNVLETAKYVIETYLKRKKESKYGVVQKHSQVCEPSFIFLTSMFKEKRNHLYFFHTTLFLVSLQDI